jgi:hypothetical protein
LLGKINISSIVGDHVKTLVDFRTGKGSLNDLLLNVIAPVIVSLILVYTHVFLSDDIINILIAALSIFVGLLLNLLVLLFTIIDKIKEQLAQKFDKIDTEFIRSVFLKKKYLKEIYSNISFSILISLISIILILFCSCSSIVIKTIFNFVSYYFLILFLITILMVLKRVNILLSKEFDSIKINQDNPDED